MTLVAPDGLSKSNTVWTTQPHAARCSVTYKLNQQRNSSNTSNRWNNYENRAIAGLTFMAPRRNEIEESVRLFTFRANWHTNMR
jgi:hypothetical protein